MKYIASANNNLKQKLFKEEIKIYKENAKN